MMAVSRSEYRRRRLISRCAEDDRFPLLITKPGDAIQLQAPKAGVKPNWQIGSESCLQAVGRASTNRVGRMVRGDRSRNPRNHRFTVGKNNRPRQGPLAGSIVHF
jgi:hypothetical protein